MEIKTRPNFEVGIFIMTAAFFTGYFKSDEQKLLLLRLPVQLPKTITEPLSFYCTIITYIPLIQTTKKDSSSKCDADKRVID